jgi:3-oxoadipate enol-lactonase
MPTIDVNGTSLYYQDQGPKDAPALIMSHSLFFDHRMFDHQAEAFSDRFRVIRYDDRDQGMSASSDLPLVDMDTLTDDAIALIEKLGVGPCFFAGNSMGGFIALRLAARRPDLLKGCIVLGSSAEEELKFEDFQPLVEGLRVRGTEPFIEQLMYIMFGDDYLADPAKTEEREIWYQRMLNLGSGIARSADGVIRRKEVISEIRNCVVPLLVLAGEQDHAYPPERSEKIAEAACNASLVVIPGAGHSVSLERYEEVNQHLLKFMERYG